MPTDPFVVFRDQLPLSGPYVGPRTRTEESLCEIWRTVLSMDCVGVDDDYNDLGGDSFLAAAIFGMMERSLGVRLPLATLVEAPTIARLALRVDALLPREPAVTGGLLGDAE